MTKFTITFKNADINKMYVYSVSGPASRKCKIGDRYYDGETSNFQASIGFVRYSRCDCQCDGQWQCQGGIYGGDRGDQSVDGKSCYSPRGGGWIILILPRGGGVLLHCCNMCDASVTGAVALPG